jgi:hypothetical protein
VSKKKRKGSKETETEEYGVVLKKRKKFRYCIFPQKGKNLKKVKIIK